MKLEDVAKEKIKYNNGIISIYLGGSRAGNYELPDSDYDFFVLVNSDYDYEKEIAFFGKFEKTHKFRNNPISLKFNADIRVRGLSLSELNNQGQKGNLTKYIPIRLLLLSFSHWKHIWGKVYSISEFKVKPCNLNEEYRYEVEKIKKLKQSVREGKTPLSYFVKSVMLIANIENLLKGFDFTPNYIEIDKRFSNDPDHIVHKCLAIRNGKKYDKTKFLQMVDDYLIYLAKIMKSRSEHGV